MDKLEHRKKKKKTLTEVKTFPIPFALIETKKNIDISTKISSKASKEQILNQAINFHAQGNISEATKYYQYLINQGFQDHKVFSNYGVILKNLGRLEEAELFYRKALELNPNFANAYSNLGNILNELGKLEEAELYTRKAIELNPSFADAYSNLGNILNDLGKLEEAELYTRKAIGLNPNCANAYSNLGIILRDIGKLNEAELYTHKAIELNPNYANAYSNLGNILRDLGQLKEAELSQRKAVEINPNLAKAHLNLGIILKDLGKLKEAELSTRKAIELNPDFAKAYYDLSLLNYSEDIKIFKDQLFSKKILNNKSQKDQINIFFARANFYHNEKNYKKSAKYLKLANNLKLTLHRFHTNTLIKKSRKLLIESDNQKIKQKENGESPESIFIVGMPRSGSTLLESILNMNTNVDDLGESNILEESLLNSREGDQKLTVAQRYWKKIKDLKKQSDKTTDKNLYNYLYAGIISSQIPNAKIIHCYRNPLDNILSIYRTNFASGNEYSSSLVDCAKVYINQEEIMTVYKDKFRSKIYDLDYDLLVSNPKHEIKSLINWLGWEWEDLYLSPHQSLRSVFTASNVQVRSPINSKSINGWKNYKEMMKPAIEIITQTDKYQNITS